MTLLSATGLSKSYAGVPALKAADLMLEAGQVHALMGENGAGKSTLIRILAGVERADAGRVQIDGRAAVIGSALAAHRLGLRFIHQELNIVPGLPVAENLLLGRAYPRRFGVLINWRAVREQALKALHSLGLDHIDPGAAMARISAGDRMLVKIASTFADSSGAPARIYVMDEPAAALTGAESERLFALIATLRLRGCAILYVSHRMDEVMRLADRISVLRDGDMVACLTRAAASRSGLIALMTGRTLQETVPVTPAAQSLDVALSVEGLTAGPLRDISFNLHRGEILGVTGLAGSGYGDLLGGLMAIHGRASGTLRLNGRPVSHRNPAGAWRNGFAFVPRERRAQGLILNRAISDNITLPHLRALSRWGVWLHRRLERACASGLASRMRVKSAGLGQPVWRLSGGNQQKVMFARAVAGAPAVLLLDEPTRGVDVAAKFDLYALLRELAASGLPVIVASSDLTELTGLASRILVIRAGRLAQTLSTTGLSQEALLAHCYGAPA